MGLSSRSNVVSLTWRWFDATSQYAGFTPRHWCEMHDSVSCAFRFSRCVGVRSRSFVQLGQLHFPSHVVVGPAVHLRSGVGVQSLLSQVCLKRATWVRPLLRVVRRRRASLGVQDNRCTWAWCRSVRAMRRAGGTRPSSTEATKLRRLVRSVRTFTGVVIWYS